MPFSTSRSSTPGTVSMATSPPPNPPGFPGSRSNTPGLFGSRANTPGAVSTSTTGGVAGAQSTSTPNTNVSGRGGSVRKRKLSENFYEEGGTEDCNDAFKTRSTIHTEAADQIKKFHTRQSKKLPHWAWRILVIIMGIKQSPSDRIITGHIMLTLTLLVAAVFGCSYIWFTVYDVYSEYTKSNALTGSVTIVLVLFWLALGIYANRLLRNLFKSKKLVESVRLHSKTVFKVSASLLLIVLGISITVLNNLDAQVTFHDSRCRNITLSVYVCRTIFVSRLCYSVVSLVWNVLVGFVVLSVCRTHTIGIRRFIRELEDDGKVYEALFRQEIIDQLQKSGDFTASALHATSCSSSEDESSEHEEDGDQWAEDDPLTSVLTLRPRSSIVRAQISSGSGGAGVGAHGWSVVRKRMLQRQNSVSSTSLQSRNHSAKSSRRNSACSQASDSDVFSAPQMSPPSQRTSFERHHLLSHPIMETLVEQCPETPGSNTTTAATAAAATRKQAAVHDDVHLIDVQVDSNTRGHEQPENVSDTDLIDLNQKHNETDVKQKRDKFIGTRAHRSLDSKVENLKEENYSAIQQNGYRSEDSSQNGVLIQKKSEPAAHQILKPVCSIEINGQPSEDHENNEDYFDGDESSTQLISSQNDSGVSNCKPHTDLYSVAKSILHKTSKDSKVNTDASVSGRLNKEVSVSERMKKDTSVSERINKEISVSERMKKDTSVSERVGGVDIKAVIDSMKGKRSVDGPEQEVKDKILTYVSEESSENDDTNERVDNNNKYPAQNIDPDPDREDYQSMGSWGGDDNPLLTNEEIFLAYWKISCRLRSTSLALQRWLFMWITFILLWSGGFLVILVSHDSRIVEIAQFILTILLIPLICSAYGEINYEGARMIKCICPTASRIDMLYLLNQMPLEITCICPTPERVEVLFILNNMPLQMTAFGFAVNYSGIVTTVGALGLAFFTKLLLDDLQFG